MTPKNSPSWGGLQPFQKLLKILQGHCKMWIPGLLSSVIDSENCWNTQHFSYFRKNFFFEADNRLTRLEGAKKKFVCTTPLLCSHSNCTKRGNSAFTRTIMSHGCLSCHDFNTLNSFINCLFWGELWVLIMNHSWKGGVKKETIAQNGTKLEQERNILIIRHPCPTFKPLLLFPVTRVW